MLFKILSEMLSKNRTEALEVLCFGRILKEALESALTVTRELPLT